MRSWIAFCVFLLCLQKGFSLYCVDCYDSPECGDPYGEITENNATGGICFKAIAIRSAGFNMEEVFQRGAIDDTEDACVKIKDKLVADGMVLSHCITCKDEDFCNSAPSHFGVAFVIAIMSAIALIL